MKRIFVLFLIYSCVVSCSTTSDEVSGNEILGTWIWIESTGGIAGTTETPESRQEVVRLEVTNSSIKRFVNNHLQSNRSYRIDRQKSLIYGVEKDMIIFGNGPKQIYFTSGDRLILIDDCKDCYHSEYQRE